MGTDSNYLFSQPNLPENPTVAKNILTGKSNLRFLFKKTDDGKKK